MATTTGTKIPATLSAIRAIWALLPCASLSACIISPSRVWLPLAVIWYSKLPFSTMAPASTVLPICLDRGTDSPVKWLSSHQPSPAVTMPSVAMRVPALARKIWPAVTCSRGRICHCASWLCGLGFLTSTCSGVSANSKLMLFRLCFLVRASRYFPILTKAITITLASKYTWGILCAIPSCPIWAVVCR